MTTASTEVVSHRRQEVQQAVKNACDKLNDDGVDPRNYIEQLAWLFFLKAFDETEDRREQEASFDDDAYRRRLNGRFRWTSWARRTDRPDQMLEFVNGRLWKHLRTFGESGDTRPFASDPIAERFRRIFSSVRNHAQRGANFARVVQQVDRLHFSDETDVIVLSELYEDLLKRVAADSAGYAGEFYTQRHIIRAMVEVVRPTLGERIYDPCFGTAGFLAEAAEHVRRTTGTLSSADLDALNRDSFFGIEWKPLTFLLGIMNMLLHGIEGANLDLGNTLERHTQNVSESNRYDVILANPPYGGKLARELQTNFHNPVGRNRDPLPPAHHGDPRRRRSGCRHHSRRRALPRRSGCEGPPAAAAGLRRAHDPVAPGRLLPALHRREDQRAVLRPSR